MLHSLTNWLKWSKTPVPIGSNTSDLEWALWLEWQKHQPPSHYEKSDLFQYYITWHPHFVRPDGSVMKEKYAHYFQYCFGDFAEIIVDPKPGSDVIAYFSLLLDIYDTCKGYCRRWIGDPIGINLVRQVIQKRSLTPLFNHNFNEYAYDYSKLHAHTVGQYSLHTLIMRLVSNYMSQTNTREYYPPISLDTCELAYRNYHYGVPKSLTLTPSFSNVSSPIRIPIPPNEDDNKACSWPRESGKLREVSTDLRCRKCNRVTENVYGLFSSCLDCHVKRICSICGETPIIIGIDDLPKCKAHHLG